MNSEKTHLDIAIIGGGIIGLMIARAISIKYKNYEVAIFEQNEYLGEHTSSRNSGVLHSGIYYENNSLKHQLCIKGNNLWDDVAKELDIKINRCGKFILSTKNNAGHELDELFDKAKNNGVLGIRKISNNELNELQEHVNVSDGMFLPSTGVIDVAGAIRKIENFIFNKNIPILLKSKAVGFQRINQDRFEFEIENSGDKITCSVLINCAGLFAVDLRKSLGLYNLENYWVKGSYLSTGQYIYNKHLIYPIPPANLKGLGVHTSFDISGKVRFGPNTEDINIINYNLNPVLKEVMYPAIKELFKNIDYNRLELDYSGIRPKVKKIGEKNQITDFVIQNEKNHGIKNYYEFCGIESPGLTAAPAIAQLLLDRL